MDNILKVIGLGTVLDLGTVFKEDSVNKVINSIPGASSAPVDVTERGFPLSFIDSIPETATKTVTEFDFASAAGNWVFWLVVAAAIVYALSWVARKFTKLAVYGVIVGVGLLYFGVITV